MNAEISLEDDGFHGSILEKYIGVSLGTFIPVILLAVFANNVSRIYFAHNLFGF